MNIFLLLSDGLNDCLCTLAGSINFALLNNISPKNIYFTHDTYHNLHEFFIFKDINYISNATNFEIPENTLTFQRSETFIQHGHSINPKTIQKYIQLHPKILKEAELYKAKIGIHFRSLELEKYASSVNPARYPKQCKDESELAYKQRYKKENELIYSQEASNIIVNNLTNYLDSFIKIYETNEFVFVSFDEPTIQIFLSTLKNIKFIPKFHKAFAHLEGRNLYTKDAVLDLAILSLCERVYYTAGSYTRASKFFNQNLILSPLQKNEKNLNLSLLQNINVFSYFVNKLKNYLLPNPIPMHTSSARKLLSGDNFLNLFEKFDNSDHSWEKISANLLSKEKNIISCKTDYINNLFEKIKNLEKNNQLGSILLITHNSDYPITENLFTKKPSSIKVWFGQNIDYENEHLHSLPIGLENLYISDGNMQNEIKARSLFCKESSQLNLIYNINRFIKYQKNLFTNLMYVNFKNNFSKRPEAYDLFKDKSWATVRRGGINRSAFLEEIEKHKFVLCLPGNGIDTHRLWETLYMGSIPIVLDSTNTRFYKDLPICFIKNIEEITEDFLLKKFEEINSQIWNYDMLDLSYWKDIILKYYDILQQSPPIG